MSQPEPKKTIEYIFIDQVPQPLRQACFGVIASQARRSQTTQKRKQKRLVAGRDAQYARGLVGWRREGPGETEDYQTDGLLQDGRTEGYLNAKKRDDPVLESDDPSVQVHGGLRVDPFNVFPESNSKSVMHMVDYYIHVWSPHKSGHFDDLLGYNTQSELCWPVALQDGMLFDATIALSRVAWVLIQRGTPTEDRMALYHQGSAMKHMQLRLLHGHTTVDEATIFSIGRMLSIAYMSNDRTAFEVHFKAFQQISGQYLIANSNTDLAKVIENRLRSWKAVQDYRLCHNLFTDNNFISPFVEDVPELSFPPDMRAVLDGRGSDYARLSLPPALTEFVLNSDMLIMICSLCELLSRPATLANSSETRTLGKCLADIQNGFCEILTRSDLSDIEIQLCCGIIAFCAQIPNLQQLMPDTGTENPLPFSRWTEVAQTFLNKKMSGYSRHSQCLAWSALALGSVLLQQPSEFLRRKGHIVHVSLLLATHGNDMLRDWLEPQVGMGVLWHAELVKVWIAEWQRSVDTHQRWQDMGVWMLGFPVEQQGGQEHEVFTYKEADDNLLEYLILRDARDSLPKI